MSQSKSEDNWAQEAFKECTREVFPLTPEEAREIKKLKRRGYKEFASAYYDYLQLGKKEGRPLEYTLKEFCKKKGIEYPLDK